MPLGIPVDKEASIVYVADGVSQPSVFKECADVNAAIPVDDRMEEGHSATLVWVIHSAVGRHHFDMH